MLFTTQKYISATILGVYALVMLFPTKSQKAMDI